MRYYLVDDDTTVIKVLSNLIEDENQGEVIGYSNDGVSALKAIIAHKPDIVLVDYLMPQLDGVSLVKEVKRILPEIQFVMISQVTDEQMVTEAYKSGIGFFISKPINRIAVKHVVGQVAEKIQLGKMLSDIHRVFQSPSGMTGNASVATIAQDERSHGDDKKRMRAIKVVLGSLGMLGEKGTADIIRTCQYLMHTRRSFDECDLEQLCLTSQDTTRTFRQRMRRAMKNGLNNLAHEGIEDYYSTNFQVYSTTLFDFEAVKAEMDHIRGKRSEGGKINMNKFFEGMLMQVDAD